LFYSNLKPPLVSKAKGLPPDL